jgi:hypothetical protein
VDWRDERLRASLDAAFHTPDDVYPVGSAEHDELRDFIPRLAAFRARQVRC